MIANAVAPGGEVALHLDGTSSQGQRGRALQAQAASWWTKGNQTPELFIPIPSWKFLPGSATRHYWLFSDWRQARQGF